MREAIGTEPAISKIFFKDSVNATVKGFDAVHVLDTPDGLELWIGEVKFYTSITKAIADVVPELEAHFRDDYLRKEFILITGKLDPSWSCTERVADLLHRNRSLDEVVSSIVVPVLLTYDKCWRRFKIDQAGRLNFDQGPAPGFRCPTVDNYTVIAAS